jgi:hypothetical protein
MAKFEKGTRVRVRITNAVKGQSASLRSTTAVRETSDAGAWTHYLYLGSGSVSVSGAIGSEKVTAEFDAEIAGDYQASSLGTTMVRELYRLGQPEADVIHFVYLNSPAVTILPTPSEPPKPKPLKPKLNEAATDTAYAAGDAIRVAFDARVMSGSMADGATRVRQVGGGGWAHYVRLDSPGVTGDTKLGLVHVEFSAQITGEFRAGPSITTEVRELAPDGTLGLAHSLFTKSSAITRLPAKTPSGKDAAVSISGSMNEISYQQVQDRIKELEEDTATAYEVIRVRNDETLAGGYADENDARRYIEDNDYDPIRVIVRETDSDADDVQELYDLNALNEHCQSVFESIGSEWNEESTLRSPGYFDGNWARGQAADVLGFQISDTGNWPLDLIDWDEAAVERRDADYALITFDGAEFYGANLS